MGSHFIKHYNILHDITVYFKLSVINELIFFVCVFCYFSVSCYCMGDIMIDKVWGGKVGFDVGNGNNPNSDLDDVCCVDWGIA